MAPECSNLSNSFPLNRNLQLLNLSSANIDSWNDIDRLNRFPALKNLRVQNWPLWSKCDSTEHERRQFVIARLPSVDVLNGGGRIGAEEREDAERAFIRHYAKRAEEERPVRYAELLGKHGQLEQLVNIDLRPEKKWENQLWFKSLLISTFYYVFRVQVKFTFNERSEVRYVDVYK